MIYRFLTKHIPRPLANAIMVFWYALLMFLIFLLKVFPDTGFIYLYK